MPDRGLDAEYRRQRAALAPWEGQPCPRCGQPMLEGQRIDAGHSVDRVLGGAGSALRWEHARCNRSAGASLGNRLRVGRTPRRWVDRWA